LYNQQNKRVAISFLSHYKHNNLEKRILRKQNSKNQIYVLRCPFTAIVFRLVAIAICMTFLMGLSSQFGLEICLCCL